MLVGERNTWCAMVWCAAAWCARYTVIVTQTCPPCAFGSCSPGQLSLNQSPSWEAGAGRSQAQGWITGERTMACYFRSHPGNPGSDCTGAAAVLPCMTFIFYQSFFSVGVFSYPPLHPSSYHQMAMGKSLFLSLLSWSLPL